VRAVLGGEARILVHVELGDPHFSGVFLRELFKRRRDHSARATPGCPEIDEYGLIALQYQLIEIRFVNGHRMPIGAWRLFRLPGLFRFWPTIQQKLGGGAHLVGCRVVEARLF